MRICETVSPALLVLGCLAGVAPAGPKAEKPADNALVIVDGEGKEHRLTTWKFVAGTRHLSWLADGKGKDAGPEALEFSEGKSPPLKKRVLTLVPLDRIRSLEFDNGKKTAALRVARAEGGEEVLHGLTGYVGVNVMAVEAEINLGELGKAEAKFQGGVARGVRSIRFPAPRPGAAPPAGRPAQVFAEPDEKKAHAVTDLQPLYLMPDNSLKAVPTLLFQKTVKIDPAKIKKMAQVGGGASVPGGPVFDVTLKEGGRHPLVLIERMDLGKGRAAFLEGLVGRVEVGYKLFPMRTITEVRFDEAPKGR